MSDQLSRDSGMTLVEVAIVSVIIGLIGIVLSATIVVVLRTSPAQAERTDDARALHGLVTWLPQDVDSTPTGYFDEGTRLSDCSGVPTSANLLHLKWFETIGGTTRTYVANYRHVEVNPGDFRIQRFSCAGTGGGPYGGGSSVTVSAGVAALPPGWTQGQLPARVEITTVSGEVTRVRFEVQMRTGKIQSIDASPKNPNEFLPIPTIPPPGGTVVPAPCTVSSLTFDENQGAQDDGIVELKDAGGGPGKLKSDIGIEIVWAGGCTGLRLAYNTGAFSESPQNFVGNALTLRGNSSAAETWTIDVHTLRVFDGAGGPYITANLDVRAKNGA